MRSGFRTYCVENLLFYVGLLDLFLVNQQVFPDDLHGIELVLLELVAYKINLEV